MRNIILVLILLLSGSGCINDIEDKMWFVDTVAVNPDGKVALCLDSEGQFLWTGEETEVYTTDLQGSYFRKITDDKAENSSVVWSPDGRYLLYTEKADDLWRLNIYSEAEGTDLNLLQEMYRIGLPRFSHDNKNIAYMVFPDDESPFGHLNIYENSSRSVYTIMENAFYDYECIPGTEKMVVLNVTGEFEDGFCGKLILKDIKNLEEEIIFNGYFQKNRNAVDMTGDGKRIVFSAGLAEAGAKEIYIYNLENRELSKWPGPGGYSFRLPTSSINGYILAHVNGDEDEWAGQLYLVSLDGNILEVPGWPVWMSGKDLVYMDLYEGAVLVLSMDTGEIINLKERFQHESQKD